VGPGLRLALAFAALAASGCGSSPTDSDRCSQTCTALLQCGVSGDQSSCATSCLNAAPVYLNCIRGLPSNTDCHALAACAFDQLTEAHCGNTRGAAGSSSCKAAADCELACSGQPFSCTCSCVAAMASSQALNLYINNSCASVYCDSECNASGNPAACATCLQSACASQAAQCQNN
jgi:hypothetical protein